jgi:hypothetical protein
MTEGLPARTPPTMNEEGRKLFKLFSEGFVDWIVFKRMGVVCVRVCNRGTWVLDV